MTMGTTDDATVSWAGQRQSLEKSISKSVYFITIIILIGPVIGTFCPPESYFGQITTSGISEAPYPITPVMLLFISLVAAVMYLRLNRTTGFYHQPLLYLYIAMAFATVLWSPQHQLTFQRALRLLPLVFLGIIYAQYFTVRMMLRMLTQAFFISAVLSILISVAVPSLGLSGQGNGYEGAWRGAIFSKNAAGFIYALGLLVCVYARASRSIPNWLFFAAISSNLIMTLRADSASAAVALVFSGGIIGVMEVVRRSKGVAPLFLMTTFVLILVGLAVSAMAAPDELASLVGRDLTLTGRTDIWQAVWYLIKLQPIRGYEYGFWVFDSPQRQSVWDAVGYHAAYSHNSWLDLWLQLGIFGLLAIVAALSLSIARGFRLVLERKGSAPAFFLLLMLYIFFRSFTEVEFVDPGTAAVFWLSWGSASIQRLRRESDRKEFTGHLSQALA